METDVVIVGAGPGGYAAAFHAADLGLKTTLIDEREKPGGVCLNIGCIPSKALLHAAQIIEEAKHSSNFGLHFENPKIELDELRNWKSKIVNQLTSGLGQLASSRGVEYIQGRAELTGPNELTIHSSESASLKFKYAVIATGSNPTEIPGIEIDTERIIDSTGALELEDIPDSLLVIGGGYIGLELGTVYAALGSRVTVVEMLDGLLPGADRDLVRPLAKKIQSEFDAVILKTRVSSVKVKDSGVEVVFEGESSDTREYDKVLVSVGRRPNSKGIGLENVGIKIDRQGFIEVDRQCRTSIPNIFAIGDVAGQPMLAHKAMREGKVAVEVIAGKKSEFDNLAIPAVVFTHPEVAWTGLTETEAKQNGIDVKIARFPWAASGRALTLDQKDGLTKMLLEPDTGRILGVGIVGPNAGELIAEATLAIEMAAVAEDLALTIHTHPTLSETLGEVAEVFLGHATHIYRK
jgi:dihydrolipoamide dehydrogenase